MSQDVAEQNIQMWKVKKLIKSLDSARGYVFVFIELTAMAADRVLYRAGTSMISLIIPPKVRRSQRPFCHLAHFSPPATGSNISCLGHVDAGIWYCEQHQVAGEQIVCPCSYHQYPAAPQVV
jgi:hypothetical protein